MYYSHPCSYCGIVFYTFQDDKHRASSTLYYGIKKHLVDYNEDHKEYQFDDGASIDINEIYYAAGESNDPIPGGQEL